MHDVNPGRDRNCPVCLAGLCFGHPPTILRILGRPWSQSALPDKESPITEGKAWATAIDEEEKGSSLHRPQEPTGKFKNSKPQHSAAKDPRQH